MSDKSIAQKLMLKEGRKVLIVNAPKGYAATLGALPLGVAVSNKPAGPADVIQVFVANRKELEAQLGKLKSLLTPGGMLWVTYYKGTAKTKTDINRDSINAYAQTMGLQGVAMISIDDDWSALRLKAVE
jgi:hypothetical protein